MLGTINMGTPRTADTGRTPPFLLLKVRGTAEAGRALRGTINMLGHKQGHPPASREYPPSAGYQHAGYNKHGNDKDGGYRQSTSRPVPQGPLSRESTFCWALRAPTIVLPRKPRGSRYTYISTPRETIEPPLPRGLPTHPSENDTH